jgi:ribosomal protein S18 acetylase RimI-like enzyme
MGGERVVLRDGTRAQVWPLLRSDRDALVAEFEQLSPESVRRRFLGPVVHLTESMLQHLVDDVDGIDHVALVLMVEVGDEVVPVAIGRVVRYPDQDDAADLAVTVKDEWQGRGVASALLPVLIAQRPARVTRLLTEVGPDNPASLAMLRALGPMRTTYDDQGGAEVEVDLAEPPVADPAAPVLASGGRYHAWREQLHTRDLVCPWLRHGS